MSLYSVRSGVDNHPEVTFLAHLTAMVLSGGIFIPSTDYEPVEPAGGGLNVDIGEGVAFVKNTGNAYPIIHDGTTVVPVDANASGSPRITTIVVFLDLAVTPGYSDQGTDVADFLDVNGSPAGSPVAPDDSTIQTAVGAGNPWTKICDVYVASGATGVSQANITDRRRRCFFRSPSPLHPVDYATTWAPDFHLSNQQEMGALTGNVAVNEPTNMEVGDWLILRFTQDGTGGRTITFFGDVTEKSADFTPASGANETTTYAIHKVTADDYDGYLVGKDY